MRELVANIDWLNGEKPDWEIVACCCGHGKYPMTIVIIRHPEELILEICHDVYINRKRNFYKRDKQGYYYIPEVNQSKQEICECKHKQWDEHKCTFDPMVAQECNVKGCKCKKFKKPEVSNGKI